MGHLYIVRHGQTQWNVQGRMQGRMDSPLTDHGVNQTKQLARWLAPLDFQGIFSSTAGRALATAQILREGRNWTVQPMEDLQETALGPWEGLLKDDIKLRWPQEFTDYWVNPEEFTPLPGMEDFPALETRCRRALECILAGRKGQNLLVISHGVTSSMLLNILEGRPWKEVFVRKFKTQTSVSLVDFHFTSPLVLYRGKTDHLDEISFGEKMV